MSEIDDLIKEIQEMRKRMNDLIVQKGSLLDRNVITASKMVDVLLNEYEKLLDENNKKDK